MIGASVIAALLVVAVGVDAQVDICSSGLPVAEGVCGGGEIPGVAGVDYPVYAEVPRTNFRCDAIGAPGYYADPASACQAFYICERQGKGTGFLCPNGTLFNQEFLVCDWWTHVDCNRAVSLYPVNLQVLAEMEAANERLGVNQRERERLAAAGVNPNNPFNNPFSNSFLNANRGPFGNQGQSPIGSPNPFANQGQGLTPFGFPGLNSPLANRSPFGPLNSPFGSNGQTTPGPFGSNNRGPNPYGNNGPIGTQTPGPFGSGNVPSNGPFGTSPSPFFNNGPNRGPYGGSNVPTNGPFGTSPSPFFNNGPNRGPFGSSNLPTNGPFPVTPAPFFNNGPNRGPFGSSNLPINGPFPTTPSPFFNNGPNRGPLGNSNVPVNGPFGTTPSPFTNNAANRGPYGNNGQINTPFGPNPDFFGNNQGNQGLSPTPIGNNNPYSNRNPFGANAQTPAPFGNQANGQFQSTPSPFANGNPSSTSSPFGASPAPVSFTSSNQPFSGTQSSKNSLVNRRPGVGGYGNSGQTPSPFPGQTSSPFDNQGQTISSTSSIGQTTRPFGNGPYGTTSSSFVTSRPTTYNPFSTPSPPSSPLGQLGQQQSGSLSGSQTNTPYGNAYNQNTGTTSVFNNASPFTTPSTPFAGPTSSTNFDSTVKPQGSLTGSSQFPSSTSAFNQDDDDDDDDDDNGAQGQISGNNNPGRPNQQNILSDNTQKFPPRESSLTENVNRPRPGSGYNYNNPNGGYQYNRPDREYLPPL